MAIQVYSFGIKSSYQHKLAFTARFSYRKYRPILKTLRTGWPHSSKTGHPLRNVDTFSDHTFSAICIKPLHCSHPPSWCQALDENRLSITNKQPGGRTPLHYRSISRTLRGRPLDPPIWVRLASAVGIQCQGASVKWYETVQIGLVFALSRSYKEALVHHNSAWNKNGDHSFFFPSSFFWSQLNHCANKQVLNSWLSRPAIKAI